MPGAANGCFEPKTASWELSNKRPVIRQMFFVFDGSEGWFSGDFDQRARLGHSRIMAAPTKIEILLPEIRAYAYSICQSSVEAEDLVQDAVERALRADNKPDKLDDLRPWMFRVVRNLFFDELRKFRIRREYLRVQGRISNEVDGSNQERDVLLRLAFEKLSPEFREILFLVDVTGLKYAEAALVIDVPKGTVMSRVSRARRALLDLVGVEDRDAITKKRK